MRIESNERDGELSLQLIGDFSIAHASRLHAEICDLCASDARVTLDATNLESLDVSSVQLIMAARNSRPNLNILWGPHEGVAETLKLTGTGQLQGKAPN
jgi:anti-anti-sigma regulatory factor